MGNKLGRNVLCPCKSGKKYKHCCLPKGIIFDFSGNQSQLKKEFSFQDYFQELNRTDLIATLAALTICPQNHGKYLRLHYLLIEALKCGTQNQKLIDSDELNSILKREMPSCYLEDPPENLFTENVISVSGNNTVYGGHFEQGTYTLNTLINAIEIYKNNYPTNYVNLFQSAVNILLALSNEIATRNFHNRNMSGEYEKGDTLINFPENLIDIKKSIYISSEWINLYCNKNNFDASVLSFLTISASDLKGNENIIGNETNPIRIKPLMKINDGYFVISPSTILSSLVNFVWIQSELYACKEQLIKHFHSICTSELSYYFSKFEYKCLDYVFINDNNINIKNALFKIDLDILIYLPIVSDTGNNYSHKTPFDSNLMLQTHEIGNYFSKTIHLIRNHFPHFKIIILFLYSSIGRQYTISLPRIENIHTIISSIYHFLCWLKGGIRDKMDIYYFLDAKQKFETTIRILNLSDFLSLYSLYESRNNSFYLNDESKTTHLYLPPGGALKIIQKAIEREDRIAVEKYYTNDIYPDTVPVIKATELVLRYIHLNTFGKKLEYYIPGFPFDLWLCAKHQNVEIPDTEKDLFWEISEMLSYWLTQVSVKVKSHLKDINFPALTIFYEVSGPQMFNDPQYYGQKILNIEDKFEVNFDFVSITVKIPWEITGYFSSPDNEGERVILKIILQSFGNLLESNNLTNTLTKNSIDSIIEEVAPLGHKKILLHINSINDLAIDPRNLAKPRFIQESRCQLIMDQILPLLQSQNSIKIVCESKIEKKQLAINIVKVLLIKLRDVLQQYNSKEILLQLMSNYESILHENALTRLRTPTRLVCFADQEDLVKELKKEIRIVDETTLSQRCLIEHLAAEPTYGNKSCNLQIMDDINAIMTSITYWGIIGDIIEFDLFNVNLEILDSGRIGTNTWEIEELFFNKFIETKINKFIGDSLENYSNIYKMEFNHSINISDQFDNAFQSETGVGIKKLNIIVQLLIQLGFEQQGKVAKLTMDQYTEVINSRIPKIQITETEALAALNFLKLWNRGNVDTVPVGFLSIDISPWRYNRRLSYLQRPLIFIDYGEDKNNNLIFWTPRNLDHSWNYITYLILSGRYRTNIKSKLEKQISIISKSRGKILQDEVVAWLKTSSNVIIHENVWISPKGKLKNVIDIGDIDILCIDQANEYILSIECKRTESARNAKEMIEQVETYFGDNSKKGYFEKHIERHTWLIENKGYLSLTFNLDLANYKILSFFVTYEVLALQFMQNRLLPIALYSLFELRNISYFELTNKVTNFSELS